ncbi:MAG: TonB-dependent receptor plug domain-containing protein [Bacillota bacterium]
MNIRFSIKFLLLNLIAVVVLFPAYSSKAYTADGLISYSAAFRSLSFNFSPFSWPDQSRGQEIFGLPFIELPDTTEEEPAETIFTDDVIVTAKKISSVSLESSRSVLVVSQQDLQSLPVENLQDALSYFSGVDLKKRGPEGVQADLSIRGGSFEQTLVLIDGVKVSDPQTGHNNLNLPLNPEDIEKIEILKGQASNIYGPNALSGAVNFVTKKDKRSSLSLNASGGENGFYKFGASFSYPFGEFANSFSFSKSRSDGYRHNTDFDITTLSYNSSVRFSSGSGNFFIGYIDKDFGANGFYSDKYPDQREHLKTFFTNLGLTFGLGSISLSPKFYWRNNKDNYLLDYTRPQFYVNDHKTNSYGTELEVSMLTGFGSITIGAETGFDDIKSSNLGSHNRKKGGVSAEAVITPISGLKIIPGAVIYKYDNFGWKYWPGIDLGYHLYEYMNIYASVGRSFRIPTFTELYYNSPAQTGNKDLHPEEAVSYETGINIITEAVSSNLGVFSRQGSDLIDWIRQTSNDPWHAENIANINTTGIDAGITIRPAELLARLPIDKVSLSYTYLNTDLKKGSYQSRYILDHLKHQFIAELLHRLPFGLRMNWTARFESRLNQQEYFITDAKLFSSFSRLELFIEALNLFNRYYMDYSGVPMPGRWIIAGIKFSPYLSY